MFSLRFAALHLGATLSSFYVPSEIVLRTISEALRFSTVSPLDKQEQDMHLEEFHRLRAEACRDFRTRTFKPHKKTRPPQALPCAATVLMYFPLTHRQVSKSFACSQKLLYSCPTGEIRMARRIRLTHKHVDGAFSRTHALSVRIHAPSNHLTETNDPAER